MFVKLTKLDGSPIWINASYVVTIEPGRGGSVVVPIGDGLDYDVREKPEKVLSLLEGAPVPAIVPVPAVDALAPTRPDDVSPEDPAPAADTLAESVAATPAPAEPAPPAESAPKPKRTRKAAKPRAKASAKKAESAPVADPAAPTDAAVAEPAAESAAPVASAEPVEPVANGVPDLSDAQIARLVKMAPRSTKKLLNTLATQFKVAVPEAALADLVARGVFTVERDHIVWRA